jgi:DNA-binding SARP family transcriptional activator
MTVNGQPWPVGPEQEQRMLVKLLAAGAAPVSHEEMTVAVWDALYARGASRDALHHLASAIRKRLKPAGLDVVNANGTYRLHVDQAAVDVHAFRALTARARELARVRDQRTVGLFEEAVRLHHGEPLTGLRGQWIDGYRHTLTEELFAAELALYESAIRHGQASERLPGLLTLRQRHPESERAVWLSMHALYRAGHQGEALRVMRDFGEYLVETDGRGTSKALNDLYQAILQEDDDLLTWEAISFPTEETGPRGRQRAYPAPDAADPGSGPSPVPDSDPPGDSAADGPRDTAASSYSFHGPVYAERGHFGPRIIYRSAP